MSQIRFALFTLTSLLLLLPTGCATKLSTASLEPISALDEIGRSAANLQNTRAKSVVLLYSLRGGQAGSAIVTSTNGLFFTAGHVLGKAGRDFIAYLPDRRTVNARALFVDHSRDFGVGILEGGPWDAVPVRSEPPRPGEWVVTFGYPDGFGNGQTPSVRTGRVRVLSGPNRRPWFVLHDCPTWKGDSGGPIFDLQGRLVAVTSWASLSPAASAAVPISSVRIPASVIEKPKTVGNPLLFHSRVASTAVPDHLRLSKVPLLGHQFGWNRRPDRVHTRQATQVSAPDEALVECLEGRSRICLGTIVDASGLVLTKESEVRDRVDHVRLHDGRVLPVRVIGVDHTADLGLLEIETSEPLPSIKIAEDSPPPPPAGHFLVSPLPEGVRCLGVLSKSAQIREKSDRMKAPKLVVDAREVATGLLIEKIAPEAARSTIGLFEGDVVIEVDGKAPEADTFRETLRGVLNSRESVGVTVWRNGRELKTKLGWFETQPPRAIRTVTSWLVRWMEGPISGRHTNLEGAFRHDMVLAPDECGGPIYDLQGRWIGLNIARAGRDRSLAWPADAIRRTLKRLQTDPK